MPHSLTYLDLSIFVAYLVGAACYSYYVYRSKQQARMSTKDYFLTEGSLKW